VAFPAARDEPGCAMSVDGEPLAPSSFGALLGTQAGQPSLSLYCAGVTLVIMRPSGPGDYEAEASFGRYPQPEYLARRCDVRVDRLAIRERGGLAARVRCDVPLVRNERGTSASPLVQLEGYVVLGPAGPIPAPIFEPNHLGGECTYTTTGEYPLEGRGGATSIGCGDNRFVVRPAVRVASIRGTFCPTCSTDYAGSCAYENVVQDAGWIAYDLSCDLAHPLSGQLGVRAHLDGPIVNTP